MFSQWFIWRKKKKSLKFDISFTGNKLIKAWVSLGLQVSTCGWVLAPVTNGDVGPPSSHSPSKVRLVRAQCNMAWPQQLNPWNITMLGGKNLSRRLSISGWRWSGSPSHTVWALEPTPWKKDWTLFYSGVVSSVRRWVGVGLLPNSAITCWGWMRDHRPAPSGRGQVSYCCFTSRVDTAVQSTWPSWRPW